MVSKCLGIHQWLVLGWFPRSAIHKTRNRWKQFHPEGLGIRLGHAKRLTLFPFFPGSMAPHEMRSFCGSLPFSPRLKVCGDHVEQAYRAPLNKAVCSVLRISLETSSDVPASLVCLQAVTLIFHSSQEHTCARLHANLHGAHLPTLALLCFPEQGPIE